MFDSNQYELLDFGDGRKLERFGQFVLDRPSPAAEDFPRTDPSAWKQADAQFSRTSATSGKWKLRTALPKAWAISHAIGDFELRATDFGHVGVFPEQADNWEWLTKQVQRAGRKLKILNLFAYTGGSTLAAASAGAEVVHVDAARNVVSWARRNVEQSGLSDAPIRWINEDATKFVRRELKRGNQYDGVILDPPSYGHGPKGEVWKLSDHLMPLLSACAELTRDRRTLLLLTCHTPGFGPAELEACLADAVFGHCQAGVRAKPLSLTTADSRKLAGGVVARFPARG